MTKEEAKDILKRYEGYPLFLKINTIKMAEPKIETEHISDANDVIIETYTLAELKKIVNE